MDDYLVPGGHRGLAGAFMWSGSCGQSVCTDYPAEGNFDVCRQHHVQRGQSEKRETSRTSVHPGWSLCGIFDLMESAPWLLMSARGEIILCLVWYLREGCEVSLYVIPVIVISHLRWALLLPPPFTKRLGEAQWFVQGGRAGRVAELGLELSPAWFQSLHCHVAESESWL